MGKYALVTGGATGIGFGCAQSLLEDGMTTTICGRRADKLEEAAATLRGFAAPGAEVRTFVCDVADEQQVADLVGVAVGPDGGLDAAVANAGTGVSGAIMAMTSDDFKRQYETNVYGAFHTIKHAALAMRDSGGGAIVAISSISAILSGRFRSPYASSKAALEAIVRVSADELGPFGIRVNALRPGGVRSEIMAPITDPNATGVLKEMQEEYLRNMPIRRLGEPEDVGAMVAFLCSDKATWVTGQCFGVDGGHSLRRGPNQEVAFRARLGDEAVDRLIGPKW
jgi:NAD(P)-dependent dehydrogenase (short-subunit alcohol dehydrogenase family)